MAQKMLFGKKTVTLNLLWSLVLATMVQLDVDNMQVRIAMATPRDGYLSSLRSVDHMTILKCSND